MKTKAPLKQVPNHPLPGSGATSVRNPLLEPIEPVFPLKGKKYTPAFRQEVVRRMLAGESGEQMARDYGISPSMAHAWRNKFMINGKSLADSTAPSSFAEATPENKEIRQIFRHHAGRYGYRRVHAEVNRQRPKDHQVGKGRVRRLMAQAGLRAHQPRSHRPRTSDGKASNPSPNLLLGRDIPNAPNQVWAGDITFIPIEGGWLYLAIVLDLYSRRIVGWKLGAHMRATLVTLAFQQAHHQRQPAPGLIFHSDRGSQYSSTLFRSELTKIGALQSMSATGNPYHNAFVESMFSRFKAELLQGGHFCDFDDAHTEIFDYFERYHNRERIHSSLEYQTPEEFEAHYILNINQQAA